MQEDGLLIETNAARVIREILGRKVLDVGAEGKNTNGFERWRALLGVPDDAALWRKQLTVHSFVSTAVLPLVKRAATQAALNVGAMRAALQDAEDLLGASTATLTFAQRSEMRNLCSGSSGLRVVEELIESQWRPIPRDLVVGLRSDLDDSIAQIEALGERGDINGLLMAPLSSAADAARLAIDFSLDVNGLVGIGPALSGVANAATTMTVGAAIESSTDLDILIEPLVVLQGLAVAAEVIGLVPQGAGDVAQITVSLAVLGRIGVSLSDRDRWPASLTTLAESIEPKALPPAGDS